MRPKEHRQAAEKFARAITQRQGDEWLHSRAELAVMFRALHPQATAVPLRKAVPALLRRSPPMTVAHIAQVLGTYPQRIRGVLAKLPDVQRLDEKPARYAL